MDLQKLQNWFRTPDGQQALAEIGKTEQPDRATLLREYTEATVTAGKLHEKHSKAERAADVVVAQAKEALKVAEQNRLNIRRQHVAERHPIDMKLSGLERQLQDCLPADAAAAVASLDKELERLRDLPHLDREGNDRFSELFDLRRELTESALHLQPADELAAAVERINSVLSPDLVAA